MYFKTCAARMRIASLALLDLIKLRKKWNLYVTVNRHESLLQVFLRFLTACYKTLLAAGRML